MTLICPRCKKEIALRENPFRPFCSERCRLLDLGNWISGAYRIPEEESEVTEEEESGSDRDLKKV